MTILQKNRKKTTMAGIPLISVCLPVYNAAEYLWECIDSILSQSFESFELLIADDGSTDASVRIIEAYKDARIHFFRMKHDYINTCNFLMSQARGKYIARMDADDIMCSNRLSIQFEYMESHSDVAIVGGGIDMIVDNSLKAVPCVDKAYDVTLDRLMMGTTLVHPTVMMRKSALMEKQLCYDPKFVYAEDYNLWVDAAIAGLRIVNLPGVFTHYRISDIQTTHQHHEIQVRNSWYVKNKIAQAINNTYFDQANELENREINTIQVKEGNLLTLIIPFLNEGEEVVNTLQSIRNYVADDVEIIVINDGSDDGWDYSSIVSPFRVTYIENKQRKGVAYNRDFGVSICQTPYFLLLDAHMRFYDSKWVNRLTSLLKEDDRVLLCCQTRFLEKNDMGCVSVRAQCPRTYGALSPFNYDDIWPDIDWNYHEQLPNEQIGFIRLSRWFFRKKQ